MRRFQLTCSLVLLAICNAGCSHIFGEIFSWQPHGNPSRGITYYVGGAGPMGNVGSFDVPGGLRDAGYSGDVRVFTWQTWLHAGDQLNISRNREKGMELAERIRRDQRLNPGARINIIALSAGTGIATFALEDLPERMPIDTVVYLGCSLSSRYDMTRALRRVTNRMYVLYSPSDGILKNLVWYTGTVDRSSSTDGIAGLEGFYLPVVVGRDTRMQYQKVVNVRYRPEFALSDYEGGHIDATARLFVRRYLAKAIMHEDARLVGRNPERRYVDYEAVNSSTTQPPKQPARNAGTPYD